MAYHVICACGNQIIVELSEAGTSKNCQCGATANVPSLSALKNQAGEEQLGPEMMIRYLYGEEPVGGRVCARCNGTPIDRVWCLVECEASSTKKDSLLYWLFVGWGSAVIESYLKPSKVHDAKVVEFYVSLCAACQETSAAANSLWGSLKTRPEFARLLEKYPNAKIWTGKPNRKETVQR